MKDTKAVIQTGYVSRILLVFNVIMAFIYFSWWLNLDHVGNVVFYSLLLFGEFYHMIMALMFWFTLWPIEDSKSKLDMSLKNYQPTVDILIPTAGEPVEIVRETVRAARNLNYTNHRVFVCNDGYVAKKENWEEYEKMAKEEGVTCFTRKVGGGYKAGNLNRTLEKTDGEIVVIFDADMVAHNDFLEKTVPYFKDKKIGFVQSPQYYHNQDLNSITGGSWEQQALFFGPIMRGKEKDNAAFICGTNVAIRRSALMEAGGMCEDNIAEDFLTSLSIHQNGWKSYYVSEVLCEGYAPEDLLSYYKQQLRWARGSLEVLFGDNPLFKKGLTFAQKTQYLSSGLYYFNGLIVFIDAIIPIISLIFGVQPVAGTTTSFAFYFLPFMFLNLYTLYLSTEQTVTFRAISFSMASWWLQIQALVSVVFKQKLAFAVTPKQAQTGNFLFLSYPHLIYAGFIIVGAIIAINREGLTPSVITNITWGLFNVIMFMPFILASYNWKGIFAKKNKLNQLSTV
ncbi:MAG: glycosyltransferase [bacterium]|nr:glycosyltransferase [bacterium]